MPEENPENEEITEEETPEEEVPEEETQEAERMGVFFSPEAIAMLFVAGLLDLFGLFCLILTLIFGIGQFISPIGDIIGLLFIGGWMFFRSGTVTTTKGGKKVAGKLLKRLGLSFLGESIPIFGDIAPCWVLAVYFELKNG